MKVMYRVIVYSLTGVPYVHLPETTKREAKERALCWRTKHPELPKPTVEEVEEE